MVNYKILPADAGITSEQLLMQQAKREKNLHFAIREHAAARAGKHLDLVIGDPSASEVADFVIFRQPSLTALQKGRKYLAQEQELHDTADFLLGPIGVTNVIEEGYGKGTWKIVARGNVEQVENKHSFILTSSKFQFQFYRFNPTQRRWYLVRMK